MQNGIFLSGIFVRAATFPCLTHFYDLGHCGCGMKAKKCYGSDAKVSQSLYVCGESDALNCWVPFSRCRRFVSFDAKINFHLTLTSKERYVCTTMAIVREKEKKRVLFIQTTQKKWFSDGLKSRLCLFLCRPSHWYARHELKISRRGRLKLSCT